MAVGFCFEQMSVLSLGFQKTSTRCRDREGHSHVPQTKATLFRFEDRCKAVKIPKSSTWLQQ